MRKTRLYNIWVTIQTSFWFIPSVMIFALFCLSFMNLGLDHELGSRYFYNQDQEVATSLLGKFLIVGPDGARAVLTTIAGSMITVAGVTFSITMVALTLAASQFGPRLLGNFMQDKSTQFVLGAFGSTFVYCLLILRSIQAGYDTFFVPIFSVNVAVVLAIINVGVLIFFIHHIAVSLKAEYVISSVYNGLSNDIERIFKDISIEEDNDTGRDEASHKRTSDGNFQNEVAVKASTGGYIQAIDHGMLLEISSQYDVVIQLLFKAGDFSVTGTHIATIKSHSGIEEELPDMIREAFIFGTQRTHEQDVEYAIHQLVEIAVRSLSKGINDPFTAISCIDYLSSVLCSLARKKLPASHRYDSGGELRLVIKEITYGDFLDSSFNQLRQHCSSSVAVTIRLMDAFIRIATCLKDAKQKEELHRHVCMLYEEGNHCLKEKQDMVDLQKRFDECVSALGLP